MAPGPLPNPFITRVILLLLFYYFILEISAELFYFEEIKKIIRYILRYSKEKLEKKLEVFNLTKYSLICFYQTPSDYD